MSVVGGRLSEGINFKDELGRCVALVGMPYPNIMAPEIKTKMKFYDDSKPQIKKDPSQLKSLFGEKLSGQVYYENLCMKAVNQAIGRALRHKKDYASILLID